MVVTARMARQWLSYQTVPLESGSREFLMNTALATLITQLLPLTTYRVKKRRRAVRLKGRLFRIEAIKMIRL